MIMAMATAAAALMAVAVLVATAAARGTLGLRDLARKEGIHDVVAVARRAGIDIDAGLSEGVNSPAADATADKHVDAACCKHAGKSAMTSTIRAYYLRGYNLTTLNVIELKLLRAAILILFSFLCDQAFASGCGAGSYTTFPPMMTRRRPLTRASATLV